MPADGAFHDRRISPETDFAFRRRLGWVGFLIGMGFADIHSALPRLDCEFTLLFVLVTGVLPGS